MGTGEGDMLSVGIGGVDELDSNVSDIAGDDFALRTSFRGGGDSTNCPFSGFMRLVWELDCRERGGGPNEV
jgi:hypothetical protein